MAWIGETGDDKGAGGAASGNLVGVGNNRGHLHEVIESHTRLRQLRRDVAPSHTRLFRRGGGSGSVWIDAQLIAELSEIVQGCIGWFACDCMSVEGEVASDPSNKYPQSDTACPGALESVNVGGLTAISL